MAASQTPEVQFATISKEEGFQAYTASPFAKIEGFSDPDGEYFEYSKVQTFFFFFFFFLFSFFFFFFFFFFFSFCSLSVNFYRDPREPVGLFLLLSKEKPLLFCVFVGVLFVFVCLFVCFCRDVFLHSSFFNQSIGFLPFSLPFPFLFAQSKIGRF